MYRTMRGLEKVRQKAMNLNMVSDPNNLSVSHRKGKRFMIKIDGRRIHFGLWPFKGRGTFIDHGDEKVRHAWQARHKQIMREGKPAYLNKESPEHYSYYLLW